MAQGGTKTGTFDFVIFDVYNYTGRSGLVVTCSTAVCEVPGSNPTAGGCVFIAKATMRHTALGTGCAPLLQCLGRLSLPSSVERSIK